MVLSVFLDDPTRPRYGLELSKAARLYTGTLYPLLSRFERSGWLDSYWEDVDESLEGRPRRRMYRLTPTGRTRAMEAIEAKFPTLVLTELPEALGWTL